MQELFSDPSYYDFPRLTTAIYSILLSFSLSTLIALTYQYTFRGIKYSRNFFQAIVLSSMVAAIIMMAIGDSLARGLGILGALAIIRFRNRIRNPKNIIFIFSSLSIGIACGVYAYTVAVAGTAIFGSVAITLFFSGYSRPESQEGSLSFNIDKTENEPEIRSRIQPFCEDLILISLSSDIGVDQQVKAEYNVTLKHGATQDQLFNILVSDEKISGLKISAKENVDRV